MRTLSVAVWLAFQCWPSALRADDGAAAAGSDVAGSDVTEGEDGNGGLICDPTCEPGAGRWGRPLGELEPERASDGEPQPGAGAAPPGTEAPYLLEMPPVRWPEGAAPQAEIDVLVLVDAAGQASLLVDGEVPLRLIAPLQRALGGARFLPARVAGKPHSARIRLRVPILDAEVHVPREVEGQATAAGLLPAVPEPVEAQGYGAVARVEPAVVGAHFLDSDVVRALPGAFGDPFRVLDMLPGVQPAFSGLPYVYVRGAPPTGTSYFFDGMPLPSLFHLGFGPAVVHPAMVGDVDFYPAVAPARYGRRVGGVVVSRGAEYALDAPVRAEVAVRVVDMQGFVDVPLGAGRGTFAVRYGYPGPLLSATSPEVHLAYWDYQARYVVPLSERLRLEVAGLGSYDRFDPSSEAQDDVALEFHRVEVRLIDTSPGWEFGVAGLLGYDGSAIGGALSGDVLRSVVRAWLSQRVVDGVRLEFGGDLQFLQTDLEASETTLDLGSGLGSLVYVSRTLDALLSDPVYGSARYRNQAGVYGTLALELSEQVSLEAGARFDSWTTEDQLQLAFDPRLTVAYQALPALRLHVAGGMGHQVASAPLPVSGLADVALEEGLQQALQAELGARWTGWPGFVFESALFYSLLLDAVLPEQLIACTGYELTDPRCADNRLGRGHVEAQGLELFVRRAASERLHGWLSYTLGWAFGGGTTYDFTPEADVRHTLNLVLQWRVGGGFSAGLRAFARSGKVRGTTLYAGGDTYLRVEERLPPFMRLDLRFAYEWTTDWADLEAAFEWMNATLAREPSDLRCTVQGLVAVPDCEVYYAPVITFPNASLRAAF